MFKTCLYLFEEVFRKKLSANEIFFVSSPKKSCASTELVRYYEKVINVFIGYTGLNNGLWPADVGYKCVNLKGGIIAWQGANMPVMKE